MNDAQRKLLIKMKKLIKAGNYKFANRKDRDYLQELLEIGISEETAWNEILKLSVIDYYYDFKPDYYKNDNNCLVFKKNINGYVVYIKLKIEEYNNRETTVCMSFHIDYK